MGRALKKSQSARNMTGGAINRARMAARPKISQEDMVGRLANIGIRINQSQFAKIESGQRPVLDYELAAIAKILKVPVQALFTVDFLLVKDSPTALRGIPAVFHELIQKL
jgi:transcriptional regulator with XRE-family HTH domain